MTATGLVLAAPTVTKIVAAQDSMVAYPPLKIEGAETLVPGSGLYFNYPTRNDPAVRFRWGGAGVGAGNQEGTLERRRGMVDP